MSEVFRIPELDVAFDDRGRFVSRDDVAKMSVVDITAKNSRQLDTIYLGGQLLDDMNNLQVRSGGWAAVVVALEFIEMIERIEEAVAWIEGHHEADPILTALEGLHARLNMIEDAALATWVTMREESLAFLRAHAKTALQFAVEFAASGAPKGDAVWAQRIALADRDSLLAVNTVIGDINSGYWMRPWSVKALSWAGPADSWENGWMDHIPDRPVKDAYGRVWDHRWAVPISVYVATVRLMVLKLTGAASQKISDEARGFIGFFADAFKRMEAGVRRTQPVMNAKEWHEKWFIRGFFPIAAADINGGYYIGGQNYWWLPQSHSTMPRPWPPQMQLAPVKNHQDYLNRHETLSRWWWNLVCRQIGLPELLQFSGILENLASGSTADPKSVFTQLHRDLRLVDTGTDPQERRARAAKYLVPVADGGADAAAKTLRVYRALRSNDERAHRLTEEYSLGLEKIGAELERDRDR